MQEEASNLNNERLSFDEKPIGGGIKIPQLEQYPPDFNPNQMEIENKPEPLPIAKRIQSKVLKVRKEALEQLLELCKDDPKKYSQFEPMTIKFITDSNPVCQEKALKILNIFVESSEQLTIQPKTLIKSVIQKCLVIQKGEIIPISTQILFWMMDHHKDILLGELNEEILNKNPKIVSNTFLFMEKLVNNYGIKKLSNLQHFQKHFIILADSVRPIAKKQSVALFKEVYRWMGDSLIAQLRMHPEVKDQIVKFSKTYTKQSMEIKRGLDQLQKKGKKSCVENLEQEQSDEPQDVLIPYDSRWVDRTLEIAKWKDKKAVLDQFIKKTNVKNIINRQNTHFISLIKRLLSENNINLLQCGFKIIKNLCKGLKKNFTHPSKAVQSLVYSKLKDTKAMIVDEVQETLRIMLQSITIQDLLDDIKDGLKDKAPNMRLQTLKFLQKILTTSKVTDKKLSNTMKILTTSFVDMHQDGSSEVRDKSIDILCKIKGYYGMNFFGDKLKKLPQKKLITIQNYINPNRDGLEMMDIEEQQEVVANELSNISLSSKLKPKPHSVKQPHQSHQGSPQNPQQQKKNMKNSKVTVISQPAPKFHPQTDFQSPNQSIRYNAYQQLLQKSPDQIYTQLVDGYRNKVPMYRQSSSNTLRILLNLIKKSLNGSKSGGVVSIDHLQFLMYHDWKKNKVLLIDFIQNHRISLNGLQYVRNHGILSTSNKRDNNCVINQNNGFSLKPLYSLVQTLLPKMSSPDYNLRIESADKLLAMIYDIPVGCINENEQQPEVMNQFYNVLKYRIQDSQNNPSTIIYQSVNKYIEIVIQLMKKGIITGKALGNQSHKGVTRQIIMILITKINDSHLQTIERFINELISNHPHLFFQLIPNELIKQSMCGPLLSIIRYYNQAFFKYADQKVYILPLLTCISMNLETNKCMQLLDQLVEINGEGLLQKIAKQAKLPNIDHYLHKWNIHVPSTTTNRIQSVSGNNNTQLIHQTQILHNKNDRINLQVESPWPLIPSPTHILKLMNSFLGMGQPFSTLASPISMSQQQQELINNLDSRFIENYSDLFIKWIFWRINIEHQPRNIRCILHLGKRIISMNFQLHVSEILILMSSLSICLGLYNMLYIPEIQQINKMLAQNDIIKEKVFYFWINILVNDQSSPENQNSSSSSTPTNQILYIIKNCFEDLIAKEMVTFARLPCVLRNIQFMKYLKSKFTVKLLTVYGFKFDRDQPSENTKVIYSKQIIPINYGQSEQCKYFVEFFRRSSSNQVVEKVLAFTENIPEALLIDTHLKIMWSVIPLYLQKQLPFINVYNYFRYLQKIIVTVNVGSSLLALIKILCYFLIDIDETRSENRSEMLKTINKLILLLLEIKDTKHILQVLILFYREQLRGGIQTKLNLLLPKCINKILKSHNFKLQIQHNSPEFIAILNYAIQQIIGILNEFSPSVESLTMKALKNILNDMLILYSNVVDHKFQMITNNPNLNETIRNILIDLLNQKSKENNRLVIQNPSTPIQVQKEGESYQSAQKLKQSKYQFNNDPKSVASIIRAVGATTEAVEMCMNKYSGRKSFINLEDDENIK